MCLIALGFELTHGLVDVLLVSTGDDHLHALLGEVLCDALADACGGGSDDGHFSFHIYL
jgi:hypothetical protein